MFSRAKKLSAMGVLGLNRRNAEYTMKYNPRRLYPLVDDKLQTKEIALKAGISVPELYAVVRTEHEIRHLRDRITGLTDFAVKPARGSGGNGILVIAGRSKHLYRKVDGQLLTEEDLRYHFSNTLSGMYSLGGHPDKVLIEYRVRFDPVFNDIIFQGVPDVRIIVFLGVPVMSMVRLPTRMSGGMANLHQGAIGAGIDIATGRTLTAVWQDDIVSEHPDTGAKITGLEIPKWDRLIEIASRCHELIGLDYMGVDIVLDRDKGPMILELNARPGLNIQIANRSGLLPRLRVVEEHHRELKSVEERVLFAKSHFQASSPSPEDFAVSG